MQSVTHSEKMSGKTYRQEFLEEFLKLFGVNEALYRSINAEEIRGTAIYDPDDPEETHEFCWHMREEDVPPKEVMEIMKVINENNWCDLDRIAVSEDELFEKMGWKNRELFATNFGRLFEIKISMMNDGKEYDAFFVHL